jgi:hypothetical protein
MSNAGAISCRTVTPEQARRVVELRQAGRRGPEITAETGVSHTVQREILQGWHWTVREGLVPRYAEVQGHG